MNTRVMLLFVAGLLANAVAATAQPAAGIPTGVWEGVITGREMGTDEGVTAQSARLVIREDGTWSMTAATWQAAGTAMRRGRRLVLDGHFISANPGTPVGSARYELSPFGGQGLGGSGSAQFQGVQITTGVQLEKLDASSSPSASPGSAESSHDSRSNFAGHLPSGSMLDRTGQVIQAP